MQINDNGIFYFYRYRAMTAILAHLSDLHLNVEFEHRRFRVRAVLEHIATLPRIDAVLLTGDLADHGLDEEYEQLREELDAVALDVPTVFTTGNHDQHAAYLRAFGARHSITDIAGLRIIGLDTSPIVRPPGLNEDAGLLDDDALDFAREALTSSRTPAVLALHHPPAGIGHAAIDPTVLMQPEALAALVAEHSCLSGILTGHVHTAHSANFAGVPVAGAPGVASTLVPSVIAKITADAAYPPGYAVHAVETTITTRAPLRTRYYVVPFQPDATTAGR